MPSLNHSYLIKAITMQIEKSDKWEAWPELVLNFNDYVCIPNISVFPKKKLQPDFFNDILKCSEIPTLAIEIASPTQSWHELIEGANNLIKAGVSRVWIVEPFTKTILVIKAEGKERYHNEKVMTAGVEIDFTKMFTTL